MALNPPRSVGCSLTVLSLLVLCLWPGDASAESLFRASASYSAPAGQPRSLFVQPTAQQVGDVVTIRVDEQVVMQNQSNVRLNRVSTIEENGTGLMNSAVRSLLTRLPLLGQGRGNTVADKLAIPSFDGLNNANTLQSRADTNRQRRIQDTISCQVLQVLPNGYLLVQGQKVNLMNREETTLYVTGIVNPYYLDKQNQINSRLVGNLQYVVGGRGMISRQQGDGIAHKIYQFFQ